MNTDKELVELLEQRNVSGRYDNLIARAKSGDFHDFKTTTEATPKMALAHELAQFPELNDVRQAVINGMYDEEWPS